MGQPSFVVGAFAEQPFTGNPAAVCVLAPGGAREVTPRGGRVLLAGRAVTVARGEHLAPGELAL